MTTQGKQDSTAIQQRIKKFEIFSKNQGKINPSFYANEGKVNAKGMIAPPVPTRSPETKLSSQKAAPPVPPKSQKVKEAGKRIVERLQADRFAADRSKFLQGMLHETDSPRVDEAINTPDKQVEQPVKRHPKVELPGVIYTTARKNHFGGGLNKLNAQNSPIASPNNRISPDLEKVKKVKEQLERVKQGNSPVVSPTDYISFNQKKSVISDNEAKNQPTASQYAMQMEKEAQESNPFKMLMGTMPSHTKEQRSESTSSSWSTSSVDSRSTTSSKLADVENLRLSTIPEVSSAAERRAQSSTATVQCSEPQKSEAPSVQSTNTPINYRDYNPIYKNTRPFSPKRFNVHPLLRNDIGGDVSPGAKRNPNLVKCKITHNGSELEAEMKRKHSFEGPEASPKHAKADIATCPTTRGNGKKGIDKPDTSHNQKPLTEGLSHVNVKALMSKFSGK